MFPGDAVWPLSKDVIAWHGRLARAVQKRCAWARRPCHAGKLMQRLLEILLGLEKGFLSREGELSLQFNPQWPGQQWVGAVSWNVLLAAAMLALVIYVYRREGRSRGVKIALGVTRGLILAFLLVLLNRPLLTLGQSRTEPSVLA